MDFPSVGASRCRLPAFLPGALFLWLSLGLAFHTMGAQRLELRDGDRVVFLGDTFFEREGVYGHVEALLTAAFPDRTVIFRNLAWAADTPMGRSRASFDWNKPESEWLKRVGEQLALVQPTVAFLNYGMTAALENRPVDDFIRDLTRLMETVEKAAGSEVRFVIWGPIAPAPPPARDGTGRAIQVKGLFESLARVNDALRDFASQRGLPFIDLMFAESLMSDLYHVRREANGIHPNEKGLRFAGRIALLSLTGRGDFTTPDDAALAALTTAIQRKNEQFFHRWRPANWTYLFGFRKHEQGQNAVEIPKFEPLVEEWDQRIAKLRNLANQDPAVVSELRALEEERHADATASRQGSDRNTPAGSSRGDSDSQPDGGFDVHPGFAVSLWAEDPLLFKPIQMNWDPKGRLWVASSRVYPQIRPGQDAEDAVIILEDRDGDGVAEHSTVFADGLLIPTGVLPDGKGGCYVAASHELLHFADDDGDGRADRRTIVLSSFGTEDTHHNLHTLRWGYDGHIYMNQSIYTHTHIETPHGVRRLNSGGIWRFQPELFRLEVFTRGGCNPWGHHWDQFGNHFFTDGAGFKGIYHAMQGATYFTYADMRREADSISPGNHPKFCSLEFVHSPVFPADWQGQLVTCDFRAHRIVRFALKEAGATFQTVQLPDLLRSTNVTFRPIDVRFGPDGALYIADWSNPIIQHGEVDFRDPRRDKEHGRIWRIAPTNEAARIASRALQRDLTELSVESLLNRTLSASGWEQEQARLLLRQRGPSILPEAMKWLGQQTDPRAKLEVIWLHEAFERTAPQLVAGLVDMSDERLRVAAARHLSRVR